MANDDRRTLREARARYFEENGFGVDGGYGDAWVDFKLGPVPFPFPNTTARIRAVQYHDLHHVLTGYRTDFPGELEISAWEIGAGCKGFVAAWVLNLTGFGGGLLLMPRRTFHAFARGRHSRSLYGLPLEQLLDTTVEDARAKTGVEAEVESTSADAALFAATSVVAAVVGTAVFAVMLALVPLGLVVTNVARRRALRTAPVDHGPPTPAFRR